LLRSVRTVLLVRGALMITTPVTSVVHSILVENTVRAPQELIPQHKQLLAGPRNYVVRGCQILGLLQ
jgi:cbb3-type cytochrome oxidase cytochrome c subunit